MPETTVRVGVVIDWANVWRGLEDLMPLKGQTLCPLCIGEHLARGNGRGDDGQLVRVHVSRGNPTGPGWGWLRTRIGYECNGWRRNPSVTCELLDNRPGPHGREVGVDVDAAAAALAMGLSGAVDVVVLFARDRDEAPAVTRLRERLTGRRGVETASWAGQTPMRVSGRHLTHNHEVDPNDVAPCIVRRRNPRGARGRRRR